MSFCILLSMGILLSSQVSASEILFFYCFFKYFFFLIVYIYSVALLFFFTFLYFGKLIYILKCVVLSYSSAVFICFKNLMSYIVKRVVLL